ncbi:MAG: MTH938/NDUFAF3 family protein [Candidatus Aenigmatarchaeota archaeon]
MNKPKIEEVEFGKIKIDGKEFGSENDIIVFWDGKIEEKEKTHFVSEKDFKKILEKDPEIVILSTGFHDCVNIDKSIDVLARMHKVKLFKLKTIEACKKFNELEGRVAILIHPTC